jgi:Cu+-exporting ATPase
LKGDKEVILTLDQLEKGDHLLIRHGELVPADAILMSGEGHIDYGFVTGESEPVPVTSGEKIYAGGRQMAGTIKLEIVEKIAQSYLTSLWNDDIFDKKTEKGPTSRLADRVATFFTVIILIVAVSTLVYWLQRDLTTAFQAFTAVLIIACPCAVALSIPFTFGNVLRILGNNHFYLKNIQVIETLSEISQIVFDKTGTITYGQGIKNRYEGTSLSEYEQSLVRSLVHQSSHPVSRQIETSFQKSPLLPVKEFVSQDGLGIEGRVEGHHIAIGSLRYMDDLDQLNTKGTWIKIDGNLKGQIILKAKYRQGLREVIHDLARRFRLSLLTGDNAREKEELEDLFGKDTMMYFNQNPHDKLTFIKSLQQQGEKVLMIGDGLNDAGALKQSDAGIVVTEQVNNFVPSCDAVLDASCFSKLPVFLKYIKRSLSIVYLAYFIALVYNVVGLSFAVKGLLSPVIAAILMPLSSITIVLIGMGISTYVAQRMKILKVSFEG